MRSFASALSVHRNAVSGRMPERSIGTDCKSVGLTPYEGSNPSPTTTVFPCKNGVFSRFGVPGRKHRRFGLLALCLHFLRRSGRAACTFPAVVRPCRPPVQTCLGSGRGAVPGSKRPPADRIGRPTEGVRRHHVTGSDSPKTGFARGRSSGGLESEFKCFDDSIEGGSACVVSGHQTAVKSRAVFCEALLQENPSLHALGHGLRRWSNSVGNVAGPLESDGGFELG